MDRPEPFEPNGANVKIFQWGDAQLESILPCDRKNAKGGSTRFDENLEIILNMTRSAKTMGCERGVFLGDIVEQSIPDSWKTVTGMATVFEESGKLGMPQDAIDGNHDIHIYEMSSSPLEAIARLRRDDFTAWHNPGIRKVGDSHLVFLPYLHEKTPADIMTIMDGLTANLTGNVYAFIHYGVTGATMGPKNMVALGDLLDAKTLHADRLKAIFAGHIHKAQVVKVGDILAHFPGSPFMVDHGECNDKKGFCTLETETGEVQWHEIPPVRRWMTIPWDAPRSTWNKNDIVKFRGEYNEGEPHPRDIIRELVRSGQAEEPFHKQFEVKVIKKNRVTRGEGVAEAGGLRESAAKLFEKMWPGYGGGEADKALLLVLDYLKEAKGGAMDKELVPVSIAGVNFMSHKQFYYEFETGTPVLIIGENGKGKTNFLEAILFVMTGETSKRLPNRMLIRRRTKQAFVGMELRGESGLYRIGRVLTRVASGTTQKVKVEYKKDGQNAWVSLADGGNRETQAILSTLLGASYTSLKATNFSFQNQPNPIINADVAERRAILAEILGFEPIKKAYEKVNKLRLTTGGEVLTLEAKESALKETLNPERRKGLLADLESQKGLSVLAEADIVAKKGTLEGNKQAVAVASQAVSDAQAVVSALPDSSKDAEAKTQAISTMTAEHETAKEKLAKEYKRLRGVAEAAEAKVTAVGKAPEFKAEALKLREEAESLRSRRDEPTAKWKEAAGKVTKLETLATAARAAASASRVKAAAARQKVDAARTAGEEETKKAKELADQKRIPAEKKLAVVVSEITAIEKKVKSFESSLDTGLCPECGQKVQSEAHIQEHLAAARVELTAKNAEKGPLEAEIKEVWEKEEAHNEAQQAHAREMATFHFEQRTCETEASGQDDVAAGFDKQIAPAKTESSEAEKIVAGLTSDALAKDTAATAKEHEAAVLEASQADAATAAAASEAKMTRTFMATVTEDGKKLVAEYEAKKKVLEAELEVLKAKVVTEAAERDKAGLLVTSTKQTLSTATAAVDEAQTALDKAVTAKSSVDNKISGLEASLAEMEAVSKRLESLLVEKQEKETELVIRNIACEGLKALPGHLIDAKIIELESGVNNYLQDFGNDDDLVISLSTQDEDGTETMLILVEGGVDSAVEISAFAAKQTASTLMPSISMEETQEDNILLDAAAYSGGQLQRIEKCFNLALADMAEDMRDVRVPILALDEPGLHLDEARKSKLIEFIHSRVSSGKTKVALVISHDRKLVSGFSKVYDFSEKVETVNVPALPEQADLLTAAAV